MNILEFMSGSPILTVCIVFLVAACIVDVVEKIKGGKD